MSWWNTSNFSDLASKALKNAQKKIDKALDINEDGTPKTSSGSEESTPAKSGDNSWTSGWGIGDTEAGADGEKTAWSFNWGQSPAKTETTSSESLIKEKTAEEIKSEVLKAAKERTKAKAKLFPQKVKQTSVKELDNEKSEITTETDKAKNVFVNEKYIKEDEKQVESFTEKTGITPETVDEVESKTLFQDASLSDSIVSIKSTENKDVEQITEEQFEQECKNLQLSASPHQLSPQAHDTTLEQKPSFTSLTELSRNTSENSFVDVKEDEKFAPEEYSSHELNIEVGTENTQTSAQHEEDNNSSHEQGLLKVVSPTDTISQVRDCEDDSKIDENSSWTEMTKPDSELNLSFEFSKEKTSTELICEDSDNTNTEEVHIDDKEMSQTGDHEIGDISSSVEFILEKDIPTVNKDFCEETYKQSGSDPELIDCDKGAMSSDTEAVSENVIDPIKEDLQTVINCDKTTEETEINVSVTESNTEDQTSVEADLVVEESTLTDRPVETGAETEKVFPSSDSESSMSRLDLSMDTCTSEETVVDQSSNQDENEKSSPLVSNVESCQDQDESSNDKSELFDTTDKIITDPSDITQDKDSEGSDKLELSPSNSYVKCMLEDAFDDSGKDDNSDNHSATEKSEGSRSNYSNHESSDEIDTTTSSDIEIISLPTPNGENRQVSPIDPIPLRIALQKSWHSSPSHRRTDSSDSSNTSSKDGGYAELSPGRDTLEEPDYKSHDTLEGQHQRYCGELPALNEEDDNPYHPQRLLKEDTPDIEVSHDQMSHDSACDLQLQFDKKLAEMSEVLQAREDKLLQISKENCDLMETNSILNNQLRQSEETREAEMADVNELTTEFTDRLTEAEKRVSNAIRDKDILKKQLQDSQAELAKRAGDIDLKYILAEKEEQIAGLLHEGEKLSKSQLQSNTIIKKLRQKEKDNESTLTSQKKKIETQKEELDHLHKVLESKEDLEKKQTEAIAQLTSAVNKQEQEMVRLKSEHEDSTEKVRGLQVALDNSYKEMAELHRNNAAQDSKANEAALSAQLQVREELKMTIEKQQQQYKWEKESFAMQIDDLRMGQVRMEKDHNRREDLLRQEIADLQKQLQEDEARTQELTQGVSLATRPLLRQIENLQSSHKAQSTTWEKVEKNISDRLNEIQTQLAVATEKERMANEQVLDLGSKVTTLETQSSRLRQEKSQMKAQLEMLKTKVEMSEDAKQSETAKIDMMKQQMSQEITELKKQKVLLETQLDVEKSKVDQEKKKVAMLQDQIRDIEHDIQRSKSRSTPVRGTPSPIHMSVSRTNSMVDSFHEQSFTAITQDELDRSFMLSSPNGNKQSLYEALRQSGAANLLENLQSQLKLRQGEITHLQSEIRDLERTRESMAKELVDLSNKNDDLELRLRDFPIIEQQLKDTDGRYNALLQMYGEKVEETNELKMDLQDVKDMYKAQSEIRDLERTRESMAKELVDLSNKNDDLELRLRDFPIIEQQLKDTDGRYNALLQMYGEKVEETNELKMDLQDVKDMYKAQINQLLSQS